MANNYTFNQISTILNNIVADAQGRTASIATTPRNTAEFVTMGQTALSAGTDAIMHSLMTMVNKTVFGYRPYTRKLKILDVDNATWGNTVRKLTPIFTGAEDQPMYDDQPADGLSTDQWKILRPKTLQTLFTGVEQYEVQAPTVFVDQLNTAFRGPDELSQFIAAQVGEVSNEIEQQSESLARMTAVNMIGATLKGNTGSVIKLLTEYNAATGLNLTATTVKQPSNYPAFIKWAYARISAVSDQMTERSTKWHISPTGYTVLRHTPKADQRLLVYAPAMEEIKTSVLSGLYNKDLLQMDVSEGVNFWQNINQPENINVDAKYMAADGSINHAVQANSHVFAILYDKEAMGVNMFNQGVAVTPVNAKGRYYNTFHHFAKRYWNDQTENVAVFTLE